MFGGGGTSLAGTPTRAALVTPVFGSVSSTFGANALPGGGGVCASAMMALSSLGAGALPCGLGAACGGVCALAGALADALAGAAGRGGGADVCTAPPACP